MSGGRDNEVRMKRIVTVEGDTGDTAPYVDALRQAGITTVFGKSLDGVNGLVLMGGTDVNPARYGEQRGPETEEPDEERDRVEAMLIGQALERNLPILAICRGMQMLNVHLGGSLVQHLETAKRHSITPDDKSLSAHSVEIVGGRELARMADGGLRQEVNSRHHQAVARIGTGLVVSAKDPMDGVIEAVELPDRRFVVGVQWHPENQITVEGNIARPLFAGFAMALR